MEATLHHQWKDAFEQGKLSYVPTTLMMSGNLEGTIWKMILLRSRHVSCAKLDTHTNCGNSYQQCNVFLPNWPLKTLKYLPLRFFKNYSIDCSTLSVSIIVRFAHISYPSDNL